MKNEDKKGGPIFKKKVITSMEFGGLPLGQ